MHKLWDIHTIPHSYKKKEEEEIYELMWRDIQYKLVSEKNQKQKTSATLCEKEGETKIYKCIKYLFEGKETLEG